jgi:hypothetical protein
MRAADARGGSSRRSTPPRDGRDVRGRLGCCATAACCRRTLPLERVARAVPSKQPRAADRRARTGTRRKLFRLIRAIPGSSRRVCGRPRSGSSRQAQRYDGAPATRAGCGMATTGRRTSRRARSAGWQREPCTPIAFDWDEASQRLLFRPGLRAHCLGGPRTRWRGSSVLGQRLSTLGWVSTGSCSTGAAPASAVRVGALRRSMMSYWAEFANERGLARALQPQRASWPGLVAAVEDAQPGIFLAARTRRGRRRRLMTPGSARHESREGA